MDGDDLLPPETHIVVMFIGRHENEFQARDSLMDEAVSGTLFIPFMRSTSALCLRRLSRRMIPIDLTVAAECALDQSQNTLRAVLMVQTRSPWSTPNAARALNIGFNCQDGFILAMHVDDEEHRLGGVVITSIVLPRIRRPAEP